jgi:hypothetical protein
VVAPYTSQMGTIHIEGEEAKEILKLGEYILKLLFFLREGTQTIPCSWQMVPLFLRNLVLPP